LRENKFFYFCAQKNTMKNYNYIVVDDEFPSFLAVKHKFKEYPNYWCAAAFSDPIKALEFIENHEIDLIFLDIDMPVMNGFQFLDALNKSIFVVLLTAYPDRFSIDAHQYYDKNLVFFSNKSQFSYYLPKIITRFEKMHNEMEMMNKVYSISKNEIKTFPIMLNKKAIPLEDILHIMIVGHNSVLKMKNGEELIYRISFKELIEILPPQHFLQISRNRIINFLHVTAFTSTTVCMGDEHFEIHLKYRNEVIAYLISKREILQPQS